ncbi:MAG: hypothetical protein ACHP6H_02070 [Legionellales bacterium]
MKPLIRFTLIAGLILSDAAFATNPIPGWYGGIMAGINRGPSGYTRTFTGTVPPDTSPIVITGTVNSSLVGGAGGALAGYRINQFRVEGELYYNYLSSATLSLPNCTLLSPNIETPTGTCGSVLTGLGLGFNGSSNAFFALINGYYDFINYDEDGTVIPYIGFGIGGVNQVNRVNFVDTITNQSIGGKVSANTYAAQLILGLSYYLDDYAWIGTDLRYLTSGSINNQKHALTTPYGEITSFGGSNSRYGLIGINFNINFSFDNSSDEKA